MPEQYAQSRMRNEGFSLSVNGALICLVILAAVSIGAAALIADAQDSASIARFNGN